jgi:hypothetical protein
MAEEQIGLASTPRTTVPNERRAHPSTLHSGHYYEVAHLQDQPKESGTRAKPDYK